MQPHPSANLTAVLRRTSETTSGTKISGKPRLITHLSKLIVLAAFVFIFLVVTSAPSSAATRTFNYPRWAGAIVDNCVTWATNCGGGGAHNFCRLKGYSRASNWRIYRPGRTYVIGSRRYCSGRGCGGYSRVTCTSGGGGGGNAAFCNNYARTAVNQQRNNLSRRCGYRSARWQLNYSNHYNWCRRVSRGSANSETNARNTGLRSCRGRGGGNAAFCGNYARSAVNQQRSNLSRRCGYRGARWQLNYSNHYNWCRRVSRGSANSETNARNTGLRSCRGRGGGGGGNAAFCNNYARTAVNQNNQNRSRRCGYSGARWSNNYTGHYNWCRRVSRGSANSETNARNTGLRSCRGRGGGGGGGGSAAFCGNYARSAVNQQRSNLSRRCGYRGARWQLNYSNHYNWCRRVSRGSANSETNARNTGLRSCRGRGRLYKSRWDKIGGPGGGWSTGWVRNQPRQICGHQHSGCRCGRGYCGNYRSGATTLWWPRGCRGPRWVIRCTSVPQ